MNKAMQSAVAAMTSVLIVAAPGAQTGAFSAAHTKELASYRLTMETTKRCTR